MSAEAITHALLGQSAALAALVDARYFPEVLPDNVPTPALVHSLIVSVDIGVIGADDYAGSQRARVELDGCAEDFAAAKAVFEEARKALLFARGSVAGVELVAVLPGGEGPNGWDPVRKLFVCSGQVFLIWRTN